MNWTEAVKLAKEGDNRGYDFLYTQTYQKNYYVALRYMKQEDAAMDVLQDAYIKAFNNLSQLQNPEKFQGWMARIVATKALDELKKTKVSLFSQVNTEDEEISMEELLEDQRIDTRPDLVIDQGETKRLVQEMIDSLSEEQKICIMMFYVEELSVKEIAETLQVSENTVKSRLKYGRKNIEGKVLELEKKGTKLYSLAPIAFFLYLLRKDVMVTQAADLPFSAQFRQADAPSGHDRPNGSNPDAGSPSGGKPDAGVPKAGSGSAGTAGKAVLTKTSALSAKKIIIGVVMALAVGGGVASGVGLAKSNANADKVQEQAEEEHTSRKDRDTDKKKEEVSEEVIRETETTEPEIQDTDQEWKDEYAALAESMPEAGNGYTLLDVEGSDVPVLVVREGIFEISPTYTYLEETIQNPSLVEITEDSRVYKGYCAIQLYVYNKQTKTAEQITSAKGDGVYPALLDQYMDAFYLTYLPEERLIVGDLVGSSAANESYSVDVANASLKAVESYIDEQQIDALPKKDVIGYRTFDQALENIDAVLQ